MTSVSQWARAAIAELHANPSISFVSQHINEISVPGNAKSEPVDVAFAAYEALVHEILPHSTALQATLVLPLLDSIEIVYQAPTPSTLQTELRRVEPPSLYLIRRSSRERWSDWEEYRVPVDFPAHRPSSGVVRVHYSCFRGAQARAKGWEFSRAIYFEHFPESLADS